MMDVLDNNYIVESLKEKNISLSIDYNQYIAEFYVNSLQIQLYIILDDNFPYDFPKVYIEQNCYEKIKHIPHVDTNQTICCFDSSRVSPNIFCKENIIVDLFFKAKNIIEAGINSKNTDDILDEYTAYWNKDVKTTDYFIIDELPKRFSLMYCYFSLKNRIIHSNKNGIKQFIENCGETYDDKCLVRCVYIPLNNVISFIPQNAYQMNLAIKNNSDYFSEYASYTTKNYSKKCIVVFSLPSNSKIICGFINPRIPQVNGYRKGHSPLLYAFSQNKHIEYEKISVYNASQERLFARGGNGLTSSNKKICIIGCGSVGSNIADAFSNCGINRFTLIDNEILTVDNIARHICGFQHIGMTKTEAVKDIISAHNPNIICDLKQENANKVLEKHIELFELCDLIISTTASSTLEYHLISKFNEGKINKPVVIMWVEPYSVCGHAIILNKPQDVFNELFDEKLSFIESVVANPDQYLKREAGCQSTYMPYSGLNVKIFVSTFVKEYISGSFESDKNYHFIWAGDIENSNGVEINEYWKILKNNSVFIERIQ